VPINKDLYEVPERFNEHQGLNKNIRCIPGLRNNEYKDGIEKFCPI